MGGDLDSWYYSSPDGGSPHKSYAQQLWRVVELAESKLMEENETLWQQLAEEKAFRLKIVREEIPKLEEALAQTKKETEVKIKELLAEAQKIAQDDKQGQNRTLRVCKSRGVIFDNMTEDEVKSALDLLKARGLVDEVEEEEDCGQHTAKLLADIKENEIRTKPEPMDDEQMMVCGQVDCELQDRDRMLLKELHDERVARLKVQMVNADLEDEKIFKDAKTGDLDLFGLLLLWFIVGAGCLLVANLL